MKIKQSLITYAIRKLLVPDIPRRNAGIIRNDTKPSPKKIPERKINGKKFALYDARNGHMVIIAPPLGCGYESAWQLSTQLLKRGASSIALDFNGFRRHGRSLNKFDIESILNDFCEILDYSRKRYDHVSFIGSCFGADVAYLSSMDSDVSLEQLVLHAPLMPWENKPLKKYIPKVWIFKSPFYSRVAKYLRQTDMIALSEILNNTQTAHSFGAVLFEQKSIEKYLRKKPAKQIRDFPVVLIGTDYDAFVPFEHTRALEERLHKRHAEVAYFQPANNHFLFNNNPKYVAGLILDKFDTCGKQAGAIEKWKQEE